jgi:carbonic anhydrase/acetyltransferase-like protein (isoleucine patch superfamily)
MNSLHRTWPLILPYAGVTPRFASPLAHAGTGSATLGRVTLGRNAWLGAYTVIRADGHFVTAGEDFHLGARSTLHIAHEVFSCTVGDRVSVGEYACVHACTLGSDIVVGDRTVILDGAVVGDNVIFEPGSTIFPGKRIDGGFLYAGSPAKRVRRLEPGEVAKRREEILRAHASATQPAAPRQSPARDSDIDASVFIASTANVRGRMIAAKSTSIWFANDFDAGPAEISIGLRSNVQDNTVIRCSGEGVRIGRDTTVGHNVTIHDSTIGDRALIGIGSVVAPGTVVQDRVLLAASARTEPGQVLESGWLYAGNPAAKLAPLDGGKQALIDMIIGHYCQYAIDFKTAESALLPAGS